MINVDKNAAYPKAVDELKEKEELFEQVELRLNKYLNNQVEQDQLKKWREGPFENGANLLRKSLEWLHNQLPSQGIFCP